MVDLELITLVLLGGFMAPIQTVSEWLFEQMGET